METKSVRELVAGVINDAIKAEVTSQKRIVKETGIPNGPLGLMRHAVTNFGVNYLDDLADHLGVEAWQLICPTRPSNQARELGRLLDAIEEPAARQNAYAIALQVLLQNPVVRAAFDKLAGERAIPTPTPVQ